MSTPSDDEFQRPIALSSKIYSSKNSRDSYRGPDQKEPFSDEYFRGGYFHNDSMSTISREELDAKLALAESRIETRLEKALGTIDAFVARVDERDLRHAADLNSIGTHIADLGSFKSTLITTAIASTLAISGLTYAMLSSMSGAFDSGRDTGMASSQAQAAAAQAEKAATAAAAAASTADASARRSEESTKEIKTVVESLTKIVLESEQRSRSPEK